MSHDPFRGNSAITPYPDETGRPRPLINRPTYPPNKPTITEALSSSEVNEEWDPYSETLQSSSDPAVELEDWIKRAALAVIPYLAFFAYGAFNIAMEYGQMSIFWEDVILSGLLVGGPAALLYWRQGFVAACILLLITAGHGILSVMELFSGSEYVGLTSLLVEGGFVVTCAYAVRLTYLLGQSRK